MIRTLASALSPLVFVTTLQAQGSPYAAVHAPGAPKATVTRAAVPLPGGFLVGADDCNAPHRAVGTGDQLGVPFVTGTTGSQGQNEALCYVFGSTSIDNDVWFDWTAGASGIATLSTCGGTSVDTKAAVWPLTLACPVDGTALACNDDACGFQTSVNWPVTAGTSYTLQLGTFPGASGGSGSFDVVTGPPPPCGVYDDGITENALGLVAGGETGWLHFQDCLQTVDAIATAYATPTGGAPPGPACSRIVCYEDTDCDGDPTTPAGGPTVMWSVTTWMQNPSTDILTAIPYPGDMGGQFTNVAPSGCTFVMATADQLSGEFPAPMDQTNPTPNAWVVGSTLGPSTLDVSNLNNNNVPPLQTDAIGFPTAWLLRVESGAAPQDYPHDPVCFGTSGCPCGNDGSAGQGCVNSTGAGAVLSADGIPYSLCDSVVLSVEGTPNQPGIFFQGDSLLGPPPMFGDGLRCCGDNVIRLGTYLPSGNATDTENGNLIGGIGPPISQHPGNAGLSYGDTRCYQWWYRDPAAGPCGTGFNLSNAVRVTWW